MPDLAAHLHDDLLAIFGRGDWRHSLASIDLEGLLSLLSADQPWASESENLRNRAAFLDLSRAIARVIRQCQVAVLERDRAPWLSTIVRRWTQEKATVLTFNYDTLVEKAYVASLDPTAGDGDYAHHWLYPLILPGVESRTGWAVLGGEERPSFDLVKLHGSINWYFSGSQTYYGESIYDVGIRPGWTSSPTDMFITKRSLVADKVPLIVPPTASKTNFFANETVRGNWRLAGQAIGEADRVVVIGYSLPRSDLLVRGLLAQAGDTQVTVVDPSATIGGHDRDLLPQPRSTDSRRLTATTRGAGGVARAQQPPWMPSRARLAGRTRLVALSSPCIG